MHRMVFEGLTENHRSCAVYHFMAVLYRPDTLMASANSRWSVFEAVPTAIAITRSNATVVYANEPLARLTGTAAAAIVGATVFRLFDSNRGDDLERLHADA